MEKPQALIIDDDEMLATFFASAFEDANYEVCTVHDGRKALLYLDDHVPNVVVLDLQLPHISGERLLSFIREDARFEHTWVFVTSIEGTRVSYLHEQADIVLTKPVAYQQVVQLAERVHPKVKSS
jgi:DNA-binding response OmpR family regulator